MEKRTIILIVVFFVLIVGGMFGYAYLKNAELNTTDTTTPEPDIDGAYDSIERVDAKHFYIDGVHTLTGEIAMPTPCDLLESSASVAESMPEQIMVDFTVVNNAEFCAQVVTPQRFKVEATASPDATFSARLQGREIELNLIPAAEGETPDDFELFIKG